MRELTSKSLSLIMVLIMVFSAVFLIGMFVGKETSVEGKASPKVDKDGYTWVDNQDPDPKIEYNWIDGTKGKHLTKIKSTMSQDTNEIYKLPFQFPFYGQYFDEVMVHGAGYLDFTPYYDYYYGYYGIPYSGYWNGFIAVNLGYNGAYYYYGSGDFKVFALEGKEFGERYVLFQWDKSYCYYFGSYYGDPGDQITYQVIIYESGLIKMQYLDMTATGNYASYSNGYYGITGIENHQGTDGLLYQGWYDAGLKDGLAIMFGKNIMEVQEASIETDEGGALYAQARDYTISALVNHPVSYTEIKVVSATFGNGLADILMYYNSDGSYAFSENDQDGYVSLNTKESKVFVEGENLRVIFKFTPDFNYPTSSFQDLVVTGAGVGAIISTMRIEDAYWVERNLDIAGSLYAYSFERGFIGAGGWVHGNENFQFRGVKAVYPGTTVSPRPGSIGFMVTDELDIAWNQDYVEDYAEIDVIAENDLVKKLFNLSISNVPPGTDVSGGFSYVINIDPFRPLPPQDIKVHADSYEDRNTEYDDDTEVFVTWEPAEDLESGILGYYVSTFDPLGEETHSGVAKWVESPDTSTKMSFDGEGPKKVWVWSVDKAGNPSVPNYAVTKIDADEVTFGEFSPGHQIWVNTHTPITSILISDGEGSGVSAKDVQYATSITSKDEYSSWVNAKIPRDAPEVRVSVKNTFENGKNNWIRFRTKDVAGNGWTYSDHYNVWVDEESPSFINFRPYETEYQNGRSVVVSLDISDLHGSREGSGIRVDTIEYRYSTGGKGLFGDWMPGEVTTQTDQSVHVEMEIEFEEGSQNYVQFRAYDNVGNYGQSKEFNVMVNSAPTVHAMLSEPVNGMDYTTVEKILFDASQTKDPDGDVLDFAWYSDIDGFLSSSSSFFKALSAGNHVITLIVNDPAHSIVRTFEILVVEQEQIDPESIDTDGDGMYDAWEIKYLLNPLRPDGFIDTDHDMFTNYQEFQNNTDPTRRTSHPPYPVPPTQDVEDKEIEEQYRVVTIAVVLISLVIVIVLILLAVSKRRNFQLEVEEEKELEAEELDYRQTLERKKSERLNMRK
ncbi:MAG: hypothetical protein ACMUHM_06695 [Thermoplasmatota archaeon]